MDFSCKKITPAEFDRLKPLFPDSDEEWIKYRAKRLKQFEENDIDVYVIEFGNKFIGEVSVNYSNHGLSTETIPNIRVYFEAFRLEEEFQGKGLGQTLMRYAVDDLTKRGYTQFTIGVEADNEIAKHIYFKFGFTEAIDHCDGECVYTLYLKTLS